ACGGAVYQTSPRRLAVGGGARGRHRAGAAAARLAAQPLLRRVVLALAAGLDDGSRREPDRLLGAQPRRAAADPRRRALVAPALAGEGLLAAPARALPGAVRRRQRLPLPTARLRQPQAGLLRLPGAGARRRTAPRRLVAPRLVGQGGCFGVDAARHGERRHVGAARGDA